MKRVLPVALAIVGLLAFAAPAPAQQFPERTVTIVVHLPPEEAAKPEAARIGEAFAHYFEYRAEVSVHDLRELFRIGLFRRLAAAPLQIKSS